MSNIDIKSKSTKERVMDILSNSQEKYISGEDISEKLGISRASVWKHINNLKKEGFDIESRSGMGYALKGKISNNLTPYEIKKNLNTEFIGQNIEYFETIDSTNMYAGKIANKSPEGTVVIANEQTKGKGRTGRRWISKEEEGLYFSLILKPEIAIVKASFLTQLAGAALVSAFENMGIDAKIKWPNDVILNGKKIAGILTEMSAEIDRIFYIVIGIGINLYNENFDDEIKEKASSLLKEGYKVSRKDFLQEFFKEFEAMYREFLCDNRNEVLDILRKKSAVIGKEIYVIDGKKRKKAKALNIDSYGNLEVRFEDGEEKTVFTGEISIRGLESYI